MLYFCVSASGNSSAGGIAFGSLYKPLDMGSSGGGAGGGLGGGKVKMRVPAELLLDGEILVDGADGHYDVTNGGGGSGGSVFIETGTLSWKFEKKCNIYLMVLMISCKLTFKHLVILMFCFTEMKFCLNLN